MSEEKKGFWSKVFGPKKQSACCSLKIEEEPEVPVESASPAKEEAEGDSGTGSCCGSGPRKPTSGGCCCG